MTFARKCFEGWAHSARVPTCATSPFDEWAAFFARELQERSPPSDEVAWAATGNVISTSMAKKRRKNSAQVERRESEQTDVLGVVDELGARAPRHRAPGAGATSDGR
jgi:hypothetical protein